MNYRHPKGVHFSLPFRFNATRKNKFRVWFYFDSSAVYVHPDSDQFDYNKLWGYKKKFFYPMRQSFMIGWRYIPNNGRIDVNAYGHAKKGDRQISSPLLSAKIKKWYYVDVEVFEGHVEMRYKERLEVVEGKFQGLKYLINPWFGGQKVPPHSVKMQIIEL